MAEGGGLNRFSALSGMQLIYWIKIVINLIFF